MAAINITQTSFAALRTILAPLGTPDRLELVLTRPNDSTQVRVSLELADSRGITIEPAGIVDAKTENQIIHDIIELFKA